MNKKEVLRLVQQTVCDYAESQGVSPAQIRLQPIFSGNNSLIPDGGSFLVTLVGKDQSAPIHLFAKRNTSVVRKKIPLAPPWRVKTIAYRPDHNIQMVNRLIALGIPVPRPLHLDESRRILISEWISFANITRLYRDAPELVPVFSKVGKLVARIHESEICYRGLKPDHIFVHPEFHDVFFIDMELCYQTGNNEDFVKNLNNFSFYLKAMFPPPVAQKAWEHFMAGYGKGRDTTFLPLTQPKEISWRKNFRWKLFGHMKTLLIVITRGRVSL